MQCHDFWGERGKWGSIQNYFYNIEEEIGWGVWRHFLEHTALTVEYLWFQVTETGIKALFCLYVVSVGPPVNLYIYKTSSDRYKYRILSACTNKKVLNRQVCVRNLILWCWMFCRMAIMTYPPTQQ